LTGLRCGRPSPTPWLAAPVAVNCLYTQTLGMMHMARIGLGVRQIVPGVPGTFEIAPKRVHEACVSAALAAVGVC